MSEFVDANIFVRILTGDDPAKATRCRALFKRAQRGEVTLVTSESVVAEVVYVLSSSSVYRIPRDTVGLALQSLLADSAIQIDHRASVLQALDLWQQSKLDFADCLSAEHIRRAGLDGIYSYDRDFDRIPGIQRREP